MHRVTMGLMKGAHAAPPIDLYETAGDVIIEADLPGADPASLRVMVTDRQLRIEGRCRPRPVQGHYLQMERCHEEFSRPVPLPAAVDANRASARYERGVLTVHLPKIRDRRNTAIAVPIAGPREED
ncbi:MAG: Hsp20/alpha crystallin family protein [Nitrospirota bacterium]